MIDIHTHVLPGIDDGARNLEESAQLVETLRNQGISLIVLTPHFYPHRESLDSFVERRENAFKMIKGFDDEIGFVLASETFLTENLMWYDNIESLCLGNTKYLLLELPFTKVWTNRTYKMIEGLMGKFGIQPIIAHIERYDAMHNKGDRESILHTLSDIGCMFQIDIDSVINLRTRHGMLRLINNGWIDFVGSDCHDMKSRLPQFNKFNEIIKKKLGQEYLDNFEKNAAKILKI